MSKNDDGQIFTGLSSAAPVQIWDALSALEPSDDGAVPDLIGAVMTLCNRVEELEKRIRELAQPNHGR